MSRSSKDTFDWNTSTRITLGVKRKIDLNIRLGYDALSAQDFFIAIVDAYVAGEPNIRRFIDDYLLARQHTKAGRRRILDNALLLESGRDILESYGITEDDVQEIYNEIEGDLVE